jgi:hypothetical protein
MMFEVGQAITWLYRLRSSRGAAERIPGVVTKVTAKRVQIEIRKRTGEPALRWVRPENLMVSPVTREDA